MPKPNYKPHKHDWDYCGSFRICRICYKVEDVWDDAILNYEKAEVHLEWQKPNNGKYMTGEFNKDDS